MFNEDTNKIFIIDLKVTVLEENTSQFFSDASVNENGNKKDNFTQEKV